MTVQEIQAQIQSYQNEGLTVFTTSSFQTHSLALLHIISQTDRSIPVFFLNTGYHFPETLSYKDKVTDLLGLNVHDLTSSVPKHQQKDEEGSLLYTSAPDYCCYLNKVQPLEPVLAEYDVWINGVRGDQSETRQNMNYEEQTQKNVTRFHPLLGWTKREAYQYVKAQNLPRHPLEGKGYMSISCQPCTRKMTPDQHGREGRWAGLNKTECGLHTELR